MTSDLQSRNRCGRVAGAWTPPWMADFSGLIDSIGNISFEARFTSMIEAACGADQVYLFNLDRGKTSVLSAVSSDGGDAAERVCKAYIDGEWWRFDPTMTEASAGATHQPQIYQTDIKRSGSNHLRDALYGRMHLRDRIMMCGRSDGDILGLSIVRSDIRGPFEADQVAQVIGLLPFAFPLVAKHCDVINRERQLSNALTRLPVIERCIAAAPESLPPREAEVCARYLYGLSTMGIASDLQIGRETVITYRKRLYDRLAIASHRELLLWYLGLYGRVHRSQDA